MSRLCVSQFGPLSIIKMKSKTNEQALEATIEKHLTGSCQEELSTLDGGVEDPEVVQRAGNGYWFGQSHDFDKEFAIDKNRFWDFLERTQHEELDKLAGQPQWQQRIIQRLDRMIKKYGIIQMLRKGLDVDDAHFTLMYALPQASSSDELKKAFESNQFSVTRQVTYSSVNLGEEIDMVVFINGLPIITMELKNHWTGQNAKFHGTKQYGERDYTQPLLQFGRCIVHLAVDTEEIYMTTKLRGKSSYFLPFNRGSEHQGAGNPVNPNGHRTAYLWDEILTRPSLASIVQHFVRLDGQAKDPLDKRTLFFPRYHQFNVVRKLVRHASANGVGPTYLIQHSAGSGKSNSITWAAFQLIETYPDREDLPGSQGLGQPLFDSVIVVTDRRLLDKQIRDNIKDFSQVKNIVAPAYNAKDLKAAMESGKKIIITTIQKFPWIIGEISDMSHKRFAVIIDEAHSSQSGAAHDEMNRAMGKQEDHEEKDAQDLIVESMRSRRRRSNASYLAFTATPKPNTLEKFGTDIGEDKRVAFDLYSMKQAIEEGFILDVLRNYNTNRSYYEIQKSIQENPIFDTIKAQKALKAYVEKHPQTIAVKAEIMMDHFIQFVYNKKKLKGKAKAMVLTQSIESAIKYYRAINRILQDKGQPFKAIVAFTGSNTMDGIEYTEETINNLPALLDTAKPTDSDYISDKLARYFDMDDYKILIVANKYLTGFDQPKLTTMYVDKKLQGVLAVQALSRLNRAAPKYGKRTEDLYVLDFFNATEDIKHAFDDFYTSTTLSGTTDLNVLHELKDHLDEQGVYEWSEVEEINELYFSGVSADDLSPKLGVAVDRFKDGLGLEEPDKADFKIKAKQFVKIYGSMASFMPFEVVRWEKLYWYLKLLIPYLIIRNPEDDALYELLNSIDLSTYGLERVKVAESIKLDDTDTEVDPQNPNPRGAHGGEEEVDELDIIINSFNERWFSQWDATPEEQRVKFVQFAANMRKHPDFEEKYANNPDQEHRDLAIQKIFQDTALKQRKNDMELYRLLAQDETFKQAMLDTMKRLLAG